jgi:hypothetical protein
MLQKKYDLMAAINSLKRYFKSLIFDCLSFTECLITLLFTTDGEAPDFNRRSTTSVCPNLAAL